jgi:cell division protein FtsQ
VILGMNLGEPQSTRAARMKTYGELVKQLDSGGAHYSQDLSEVDLSDAEDVKVLANDAGGEVLVHLGSSDYLERFKIYKGHAQEWRQQFARLDSVDLRYEHQIVVNPDLQGAVKEPPLAMSAVRAAMAAGVKPAALVSHEFAKPVAATPPSPAVKQQVKVVAAKKKVSKARHRRKVALKRTSATGNPAATSAKAAQTGAQQPTTQKSSSAATGNAAKPGPKPSPAIPKEQTPP